MNKDFFDFKLSHPIASDVKELVLYRPRNAHVPLMAPIDAMIMSAMKATMTTTTTSSGVEEEASSEVDGAQLINQIKFSMADQEDKFLKFCDLFKALLLSDNVCKIKHPDPNINNRNLTEGYYDQMIYDDGQRLMGEYLKHFFTLFASI